MPSQVSSGVEQFNVFARFAASRMYADMNAIARSDGVGTAEGAHAPFHISAASDDKVRALRRSPSCKAANNDTRDVFMRAVSDMFNGDIPKNVQKAMKLNDFNRGRPLTVRRIIAVRDAILAEAAARQIPDAIAAINRDRPEPGIKLTKSQMKLATELFIANASVSAGIHCKNNDILAAFIVRLVATPNLPKPPYSYLPNVAGPIPNFVSSIPEILGRSVWTRSSRSTCATWSRSAASDTNLSTGTTSASDSSRTQITAATPSPDTRSSMDNPPPPRSLTPSRVP